MRYPWFGKRPICQAPVEDEFQSQVETLLKQRASFFLGQLASACVSSVLRETRHNGCIFVA